MDTVSTPISDALAPARFLERPNRFLLTVRLEDTGEDVSAHMADPGRLKELLQPGSRVWLRSARSARRKTRWTAVLVEAPQGGEMVSLDTTLANRLVRAGLEADLLEEFSGWELVRSEVPHGRSRFDFLLSGFGGRKMILEVKSVTLVIGEVGLFPDAITDRGRRHVMELEELVGSGEWDASVLFILQRSDARRIRAAKEIDPRFAYALESASKAGVRVLGRRCRVSLDRVDLGAPVAVEVG